MFRFTADNATDPTIGSFAQRNVLVTQQHLEMLRSAVPTAMRTGS
jgi:hypothetical protein